MSYDLHVFSKRRPRAGDLDAFLTAKRALKADGRLKRDGYLLLTDADAVHAEIDGPGQVESEDLPDAANGAIGERGWLLQISVKPSTDAAWPNELAAHIARGSDGIVYDPQEDRVTWPVGFQARDPNSGEERITEVELVWYTPRTGTDASVPRQLLSLLREHAPESVPRRYGAVEPLPFRLGGPADDDEFVLRWQEEAAAWMPMLFWTATRPSFGGSATISTMQDPDPPRPGEPITKISLTFDGRPFARDPDFTERVLRLFVESAAALGCIYAGGAVHRDVTLRRGRQSVNPRTETGPFPQALRWVGLPAAPTWIAWFGRPYTDLVRPSVTDFIALERDGGLLLRMGDEPMNSDQLAAVFPPLPLNLIARGRDRPPEWESRTRYTFSSDPPSHPAELIPG